jgi:hypothetical protein
MNSSDYDNRSAWDRTLTRSAGSNPRALEASYPGFAHFYRSEPQKVNQASLSERTWGGLPLYSATPLAPQAPPPALNLHLAKLSLHQPSDVPNRYRR